MQLNVNGKDVTVDVPADTPLLWAIRDELNLTGTKYGCGMSLCGACTIHLDGKAIRSCVTPISAAAGKKITTIEGVATDAGPNAEAAKTARAVQDAWTKLNVPQCGYCQSGQIMNATALLVATPKPTDAQIDSAMAGVICRCGTYQRIRAAIHRAAESVS